MSCGKRYQRRAVLKHLLGVIRQHGSSTRTKKSARQGWGRVPKHSRKRSAGKAKVLCPYCASGVQRTAGQGPHLYRGPMLSLYLQWLNELQFCITRISKISKLSNTTSTMPIKEHNTLYTSGRDKNDGGGLACIARGVALLWYNIFNWICKYNLLGELAFVVQFVL